MNGLFSGILIVIIGLLIGSTLNMIIYRLPIILNIKKHTHPFSQFNLFFPRSHCPKCNHTITWWQNIPILSFLKLRGQCYYCQSPIPKQYLFTECVFPLLMLGIYLTHQNWTFLAISTWFCMFAYILAAIDFKHLILPDVLNYILLWSGLWINSFNILCPLEHAVYGAIVAYISLWSIYHIFIKLTGKQGFGYGDFKFFAAIGAWFGITQIYFILMCACLIGILFAVGRMIIKKNRTLSEPLPFGPALACASYIFLVGQAIF